MRFLALFVLFGSRIIIQMALQRCNVSIFPISGLNFGSFLGESLEVNFLRVSFSGGLFFGAGQMGSYANGVGRI